MRINDAGLALIKTFEGLALSAYRDVAGIWTIGYGDTHDVVEGQTISQSEAETRLLNRLVKFEADATRLIKATVNENEFSAMVCLAYNIGLKAFADSHVLYFVNSGETLAAANSFLLWNKAGGKIVPGLIRRREAERALFLEPTKAPLAA